MANYRTPSMATATGELGFQTLTSRIYASLHESIIKGQRPPGQRLVRRRLGLEFGASALPVMEALYRLEQDGLVESVPMYGTRVRILSVDRVRSDHVVREALECQAARMCAELATEDELAELEHLAHGLDLAMVADTRAAGVAASHLDFHLRIARAGRADGLEELLRKSWFQRLMWLNTLTLPREPLPADWHRQLVQALASHDPELAERQMRRHVRHGVTRQLAILAEQLAKGFQA